MTKLKDVKFGDMLPVMAFDGLATEARIIGIDGGCANAVNVLKDQSGHVMMSYCSSSATWVDEWSKYADCAGYADYALASASAEQACWSYSTNGIYCAAGCIDGSVIYPAWATIDELPPCAKVAYYTE